jgi:hypothetical protein
LFRKSAPINRQLLAALALQKPPVIAKLRKQLIAVEELPVINYII